MRNKGKILICFIILMIAYLIMGEEAKADYNSDALGVITRSASSAESQVTLSELGALSAEAVRSCVGVDVVILNGGDFHADLTAGEITQEMVDEIFPDDKVLAVTEVSGAELYEMAELGLSYVVINTDEYIDVVNSAYDGFPQFAGFSVTYDVSDQPGNRIIRLTLNDGTEITSESDEVKLSFAATEFMLSGGYGYPAFDYVVTKLTLRQSLSEYFLQNGQVPVSSDSELKIVGSNDSSLVSGIPRFALVGCALLVMVVSAVFWHRERIFDY